jgi:hypothetical protein
MLATGYPGKDSTAYFRRLYLPPTHEPLSGTPLRGESTILLQWQLRALPWVHSKEKDGHGESQYHPDVRRRAHFWTPAEFNLSRFDKRALSCGASPE